MTVTESRIELEAALTNGGLRVLAQGNAAPPSVFVSPDTPWLSPAQLAGKRICNWAVFTVVSASNESAIEEIEKIADQVTEALKSLRGSWGLPTVQMPGVLTLAGLPYIGFKAVISVTI